MATDDDAHFGGLLRRLRLAAALSQEELAERAGLSVRGISDLERGVRRAPRLETVRLLADALDLDPAQRSALLAAARPEHGPEASRYLDAETDVATPVPVPRTPIVGRARDLERVRTLILDEGSSLVTLTGPGGVGKTRLAIEVASALGPDFAGAVTFVPLATITDPARAAPAVARAHGVRDVPGQPVVDALIAALEGRRRLLVLDNFEQVLDAAPFVASLLVACPELAVLVTSRSALRVRGEHLYPVPPLPTLEGPASPAADDAFATSPAVTLFIQRAHQVRPDFAPNADGLATIATICRRLDGLPLAIELAAPQVRVLGTGALLARLDRRLPLLTHGPRDAPDRQRTMHGAIEWSYDLLDPTEQRLFRQLAVFVGGFTLETAEALCAAGDGDTLDVFEVIASLADKSLIQPVPQPDDEPRWGMLETVREYAVERLRASGEAERTRDAHARVILELVEAAKHGLVGAEQGKWLARLDAEDGNVQAALAWVIGRESAELAQRLASAPWRYWTIRGRLGEGREWLEQALALGTGGESPVGRADAAVALGNLAFDLGDYATARARYEEGLVLRRAVGHEDGVADALNNLGLMVATQGDYAAARALHLESLAIRRRLNLPYKLAMSLSNLGDVALAEGEFAEAERLHEEALRVRRGIADAGGIAYSVYNLGEVARLRGDPATAQPLLEESLRRFEELGDRLGIAYSGWSLGYLDVDTGNAAAAAVRFGTALTVRRDTGDRRGTVECVEGLAAVAARRGQPRVAARLYGAADALRAALGAPLPPVDRPGRERTIDGLRAALGDDAFAAAQADGRTMELHQAAAEAAQIAAAATRWPTEPLGQPASG